MGRYRNQRVPVLGPRARELYLSRDRASWDFLKTVSKEELLDYAHKLGMRFATDNWQHQLVCFVIMAQCRELALFLKQSGGKSKVIIDAIRYRRRTKELGRALILVPELLHAASWEDQLKEHGPDLTYQIAIGSKSKRDRMLAKDTDVVVMNFAGLQMFMTERKQIRVGKDAETNEVITRGRNVIDPDKAARFMVENGFNFCYIDEIHRIVEMGSTLYDLFTWCMAACDFKYIGTGTPHGTDPSPLFGQFQLIDNGETLGPEAMFRHVFFTPTQHPFKGVVWSFDKKSTPELHRVIKHRSISYEVTEYKNMPPKLHIRVPVRLRGEGAAYYERIVQGLIEAQGDYTSLDNVFVRMRQCASGFVAMKADDESRIQIEFTENPKLEALQQFVLGRDEKLLVFHEYRISAQIIERMFEQQGIKWAAIRGGMRATAAAEYQRFLKQDSCKVFLLNNQLGSEAINPQYICRRAVFYESPSGSKRRDQAEMRVWRQGQAWNVWLHDLLVLGTIEEKIRRYNQEGHDLLRAVMTGDETLITEAP